MTEAGGATTTDSVVLASSADTAAAMADVLSGVTADAGNLSLPTVNGLSTIYYSTDLLTSENLGKITIKGVYELSMDKGTSLTVRPGGTITLTGVTTIDGSLTAHGGTIALTGYTYLSNSSVAALGDYVATALTIGSDAVLDVSGLWVNDSGLDSLTLQGSAWINGGSITLVTDVSSAKVGSGNGHDNGDGTYTYTAQDETSSIILAAGSVLDLESGGYVSTKGVLKTDTDGLPSGNGGNLTLQTYAGTWYSDTYNGTANYPVAPVTATAATVVMDGTIYAAGLNEGGTLTLQVPAIAIDGTATTVATDTTTGAVTLPTSFFTQGFSTYKLTSTYGDITVAAGTTLTLKQQTYQLSSTTTLPATGALVRDFASLGYALDGLRQAVDLTLTQQGYGGFAYSTDPDHPAGITIGAGASIVADPGATTGAVITLSADGPVTILGSIIAHGGSIAITSDDTGLTYSANYKAAQDVWIGADAVLDVSGTYVPDPLVTAYTTGSVLDGGSITLSSDGTIVALAGSTFDLQGASATIQEPSGGTSLRTAGIVTSPIWSDGGILTLGGNEVYFSGTISAAGGAASASGGTLNITDGATILITQSGDVASALSSASAPTTASSLTALGLTSGTALITADTINGAGLDSVSLTGTTIAFAGDVTLKVPDALYLNGDIALLPAGATGTAAATATVASTVTLAAG
ncbi:MAG: hypothetical protein P4L83_14875, partial [Nevskia sp.]|nr:hypothetical protein [Nevskia sp.]